MAHPIRPARGTLTSLDGVRLNEEMRLALEQSAGARAALLTATAGVVPGEGGVVLHADGGLWVAVGHERFWTLVGVAAGAWTVAGQDSKVVPRYEAKQRERAARSHASTLRSGR